VAELFPQGPSDQKKPTTATRCKAPSEARVRSSVSLLRMCELCPLSPKATVSSAFSYSAASVCSRAWTRPRTAIVTGRGRIGRQFDQDAMSLRSKAEPVGVGGQKAKDFAYGQVSRLRAAFCCFLVRSGSLGCRNFQPPRETKCNRHGSLCTRF
jgi:hypothetical protein